MGLADALKVDVFFDYLCPFVYRASLLLDAVQRSGTRDIEVHWRYFSLTQVNSKNDGWTVWTAPASEMVRGRLAFAAAEAARRQGRFDAFHHALLSARHRDRLDIDAPDRFRWVVFIPNPERQSLRALAAHVRDACTRPQALRRGKGMRAATVILVGEP